MSFDWNRAFHAVVILVTIFGFPSLIVAAMWCFLDEHPLLGILFSLLFLVLIGFVAGLPEVVLE